MTRDGFIEFLERVVRDRDAVNGCGGPVWVYNDQEPLAAEAAVDAMQQIAASLQSSAVEGVGDAALDKIPGQVCHSMGFGWGMSQREDAAMSEMLRRAFALGASTFPTRADTVEEADETLERVATAIGKHRVLAILDGDESPDLVDDMMASVPDEDDFSCARAAIRALSQTKGEKT